MFLKGVFEPAWSTDGKKMVYYNNTPGDPVSVADATGANDRQVFVGEQSGLHNHNPVWSTDGQWIYFTHGYTDEMDVWRMPSSGGVPERVTQHNAKVSFLAPLDSRTLLYVAPAEDRSGPWLWALDVERKSLTGQAPASSNIGSSRPAPMAGASSRRWPIPAPAYGPCHCSDVWPRSATSDRFRCLRFVPWRRDSAGRRCFICQHTGPETVGPETGCGAFTMERHPRIWKSSDGALVEPPAISYDGQRVVFTLRRDGKRRLASCRRRALGHGRWPHPSTFETLPTGRRMRDGSSLAVATTRRARDCSKCPWMGEPPFGWRQGPLRIRSGRRTGP